MERVDILISGGGIAGLIAAAALGHRGHAVLLVDPAPGGKTDLRSTAYLQPARALFEAIGLWPELAPHATPLNALRVVDTQGWPPQITESRTFLPQSLGEETFGWNIPNALAHAALLAGLRKQPNVDIALGVGFKSMLTRTSEARLRLSDGRQVAAKLVVAADGRASPVRAAAGIAASTTRYGQKALAFHATHAQPHENTSIEIYNQGGAFTTVPLPDHQGQPASAVVWMQEGAAALRAATLDEQAFNSEMTARACAQLGAMHRLSAPNLWPVVTQTASRLTAERVVLIAEAAHVLPPIGAQGLNSSVQDIAALYRVAAPGAAPLGSPEQLQQYEAARARDTALRAQAIDLFNRVCRSGSPLTQALRSTGLRAAHDIAPLRQMLMRAGIGQS
ncbi:2-octaprenyl-6-methoxyphenol hydroxylase [Candidatus Rhodobacter oscarellae]|uniref:2-octaprenyl-6-methoxyphenol hydroxylase n=1 Tax=Candidatus Rhodobacter oscarellae TaxID=1675527 RepID=A0A0J9E223_9RHOB|nr:FAD-dependent oxidoreductase [Candidatus Rhodobacter lobularis]KMW56775.1 2-octaprenyl-6-methoxyphenol hydroxylase [Candidatus Rhodobacter lobularis]